MSIEIKREVLNIRYIVCEIQIHESWLKGKNHVFDVFVSDGVIKVYANSDIVVSASVSKDGIECYPISANNHLPNE